MKTGKVKISKVNNGKVKTRNVKMTSKPFRWQLFAMLACLAASADAAENEHAGKALYQSLCAACHGEDLRGGRGSSLVDEEGRQGRERESLYRTIQEGIVAKGMPGFRDLLTETQINRLIDFIHAAPTGPRYQSAASQVLETLDYAVEVAVVVDGLEVPWGIAFPGGKTSC